MALLKIGKIKVDQWPAIVNSIMVLAVLSTKAATIMVTQCADTGIGSLSQTLTRAQSGDSIAFQLTSGSETIVISNPITLAKNLTFDGSNSAGSGKQVTIKVPVSYSEARANGNAPSPFRVFLITRGTITLRNVSLIGGRVEPDLLSYGESEKKAGGGAIAITGRDSTNVTLICVSVSGSCARDSFENRLGIPRLRSCGGGIYNEGHLIMDSCSVVRNALYTFAYANASVAQATADGGGICNTWIMEIRRSSILENRAEAFAEYDASPRAYAHGGGIYNEGTLRILASTIASDTAASAATFYQLGSGYSYGGGICNNGKLYVCNSTLYGNCAYSTAYLGPDHSWYSAGSAYASGGAIFIGDQSNAEIVSTTVVDNQVSATSDGRGYYYGRGVSIQGVACLLNCIITCPPAYNLVDIFDESGILRAYHNVVSVVTDKATVALKGGLWDASNRSDRITEEIFGAQSPLLSNNGGPTQTIALPLNSNAAGNGVRTGSYSKNDTVHYDAFWNGTAWIAASTGGTVSGVKELTVDQRGTPIEPPPSMGSFYIKGSSISFNPIHTSSAVFSLVRNHDATLTILNHSKKNGIVRLIGLNGRCLQNFALDTKRTLDVSMLSAGIYFLRIEGLGNGVKVEKILKN